MSTEMEDGPSAEQEASELGWVPKDRFRGDQERWVDAETFVRRGKEIMPILRENNRRLEGEVHNLKSALQDNNKSIEDLKKFQVELLRTKLEEQRVTLLGQIQSAREEGNVALEVELADKLSDVKAEAKEAAKAPVVQPAAQTNPDFDSWKVSNAWFGTDKRKTALAIAIASELRESDPNLAGVRFFQKVDAELAAELKTKPAVDKVEGSRSGGRESGGSVAGFDSLPAEAKAQARADVSRFVGPNKVFKTEKDWFAHYTKLFNGE